MFQSTNSNGDETKAEDYLFYGGEYPSFDPLDIEARRKQEEARRIEDEKKGKIKPWTFPLNQGPNKWKIWKQQEKEKERKTNLRKQSEDVRNKEEKKRKEEEKIKKEKRIRKEEKIKKEEELERIKRKEEKRSNIPSLPTPPIWGLYDKFD